MGNDSLRAASGSRTRAGGQKEIHLHPSGLDQPPGLPPEDQVFMGISWNGAAVETHTHPPAREEGMEDGGVGVGGSRTGPGTHRTR